MIRFKKNDGLIILNYQTDNDINWLKEKFEDDESYSFKRTYTLNSSNIYQNNLTEETKEMEEAPIEAIDISKIEVEKLGLSIVTCEIKLSEPDFVLLRILTRTERPGLSGCLISSC